jgi:hypothetical protein
MAWKILEAPVLGIDLPKRISAENPIGARQRQCRDTKICHSP